LEVVEKLAVSASPALMHAATTRTDPQRGEAIILYTTDAALSREALLTAARNSGTPEIAVPREIRVVDALPLLGTGKIDHVTLKRMAEAA
jgi:acyl-[acyl-carrier-protein]-phospholipid O-acyltransferase/long-chain-fatty-acid--[acyl-carrier-protein] ligase